MSTLDVHRFNFTPPTPLPLRIIKPYPKNPKPQSALKQKARAKEFHFNPFVKIKGRPPWRYEPIDYLFLDNSRSHLV
jgi:hypothetical protein